MVQLSFHYRYQVPLPERALAALAWLSGLLPAGFIFSFLLYDRSPSVFLRRQAWFAGLFSLLHFGLLFSGNTLNLLLLFESAEQFTSYEQLIGGLFAADPLLPVLLLFVQGLVFLQLARRMAFPESMLPLILAIMVPVFYYNKALWSPVSEGEGLSFFSLDLASFRNPLSLVPGHFFLLVTFLGAVLAFTRGSRFRFWRSFYVRVLLDGRASGARRRSAALLRSWVPGWGFFFLGQRTSGLFFFCFFLLSGLFFALSLALNYGEWVKNTPGFNANAAWYLLGNLGLKSTRSDAFLKSALGGPASLVGLSLLVALCVVYSRWRTARISDFPEKRFSLLLPASALFHVVPLAMALLIPVSFVSLRPPAERRSSPPQAIPVIPRFFEEQAEMELNGSRVSGKPDGDGEEPAARAPEPPLPGPGPVAPGTTPWREGTGKGTGLKGDRAQMTYSNYLSARIRAAESWLGYWSVVPQPYSAVFRYRISASGELEGVSILEPSVHARADQLTVQLVEAMGHLLPPPGDSAVEVTELFWNTSPDDPSLPTETQKALSRAFDGRVIEAD